MDKFISLISRWTSAFPRITVSNLIEIAIIAVIVYEILAWIKNTRSLALLRGLLVIGAFTVMCLIFHFDTILWILGRVATIFVLALVVIFQPELRRGLERIGSGTYFRGLFRGSYNDGSFDERAVEEIVRACFALSRTRTGALIVIENQDSLKAIEQTGIEINGNISSQLLINIFEHNTPLHDGAVVVRDDLIAAATCYLPLSENMSINKSLGTRHRAAIGISEVTDSVTVVVSEETGAVSVAEHGALDAMEDPEALRARLKSMIAETSERYALLRWKGWRQNEK